MDRLKGVLTFSLVTIAAFALLRLIHLGIPIFYPKVLSGPFSLDHLESVADYTGFSPLLPFYHPAELGARPVHITVTRRPYPKVVIFWHAEHFLYLAEQRGGTLAPAPLPPEPLPGFPHAQWWREGDTHTVILTIEDIAVELRTDLPLRDVQRIIDSLRPYEKLL